ncbi:MAG: aminopeptidase N [Actinobacteria bacterium]|nr:aminopeptidase N [Actinomycetota bacterium]
MPERNLTRDEAGTRSAVVTTGSYQVDLDLTRGPDVFGSTTVARFAAVAGATTFIDLIARKVRTVELNGRELDVAATVTDGRVAIGPLAAQNVLRVVADCEYTRSGEGLHRFVDPVDEQVYLYSQFEVADARRVMACFDQPDLKATFELTVTAPAGWTVVSNEAPDGEPTATEDGAVWHFPPTPPLATYVTAVVAGPYHAVHGELTSSDGRTIPLGVYCRASLAPYLDAPDVMAVTRAGFVFFEEAFGRPYPFSTYDQLFVPEFNAGAMENAGAVTFAESYVFRSAVPDATVERRAVTILHELAHMWFGDLVTMRWWDDLWLNESFAEFMSTLATARATRWTGVWATFASREKAWAYQQDQLPTTHPIVADMRDLEDVEVNFDGITYAKGASVLRQLVAWVGEEAFLAGVRDYFEAHAWGNTELKDLLTRLEATSGRDLSAWSAVWLQQSGVTLLRPRLESRDGVLTAAAVVQEAPSAQMVLPPHRLALGAYDLVDGRLIRTWRTEIDMVGAVTEVPQLIGRPVPAVLLVNDDDLTYARVRLDPQSLSTATAHLADLDDPLARAVVWSCLWDATRDGELPASQFVEAVGDALDWATDSSLVLVMLRQLATTLDLWVAPERRPAVTDRVVDRMLELVHREGTDADVRLQVLRAVARHGRTDRVLDVLDALLSGHSSLPGLTVDADLRWDLLTALVAGGRAGEDRITAELVRDPSATGVRSAALARAAVPTSAAKAAAWQAVVEHGSLTNAQQAATTLGFGRAHDPELLRPYVQPYFAAIERVWATRSNEMAQGVVEGMFPLSLAGDPQVDLLAETDRWLAEHPGSVAAMRRLVTESRDAVRRALAAQAADRAAG